MDSGFLYYCFTYILLIIFCCLLYSDIKDIANKDSSGFNAVMRLIITFQVFRIILALTVLQYLNN